MTIESIKEKAISDLPQALLEFKNAIGSQHDLYDNILMLHARLNDIMDTPTLIKLLKESYEELEKPANNLEGQVLSFRICLNQFRHNLAKMILMNMS